MMVHSEATRVLREIVLSSLRIETGMMLEIMLAVISPRKKCLLMRDAVKAVNRWCLSKPMKCGDLLGESVPLQAQVMMRDSGIQDPLLSASSLDLRKSIPPSRRSRTEQYATGIAPR